VITEGKIQETVSSAEKLFNDCLNKLFAINDAESLFSFQPTLITALYQIEVIYQGVCKQERGLKSQITKSNQKQISERIKILTVYKSVLNQVADIGKVLGDAFAWLFYENEKQLLKKHYDHEFIPHLPMGTGGRGEYEFIKNTPRFGQYIVLAHSITTFLRHGDVSLIDPSNLKVAAIGELKSQKKSDTEISVNIYLAGAKLPKEMLPKVAEPQSDQTRESSGQMLPPEILDRLNRQMKGIQEAFKPHATGNRPEKIEVQLVEIGLKNLFADSSVGKWGGIKADRGLLLLGIKSDEMPMYSQLKGEALVDSNSFKENLDALKDKVNEITDLKLPHNCVITSSMLYPSNDRYFLPFGMKPFLWWPLESQVRKAILFQKFRVMTLYNPAFLVRELNQNGFEVGFDKDRKWKITKESNGKHFEISGLDHFIGAVRTQLLADASIVDFVRTAFEKTMAENFTQPTQVHVDLDFLHN
jgi:hypothetical protein